jgi:hypothetical protein
VRGQYWGHGRTKGKNEEADSTKGTLVNVPIIIAVPYMKVLGKTLSHIKQARSLFSRLSKHQMTTTLHIPTTRAGPHHFG